MTLENSCILQSMSVDELTKEFIDLGDPSFVFGDHDELITAHDHDVVQASSTSSQSTKRKNKVHVAPTVTPTMDSLPKAFFNGMSRANIMSYKYTVTYSALCRTSKQSHLSPKVTLSQLHLLTYLENKNSFNSINPGKPAIFFTSLALMISANSSSYKFTVLKGG